MAGLSNVQRTIAWLKDQGITCCVVERWIPNPKHPGGGFKLDFLNIIDLIALSKADGIVGYQVCGTDYAPHYKKITEEHEESTREWLDSGGRLILIGWRKLKVTRGGKAMRWTPRIEEITLEKLNRGEPSEDTNDS